VYSKLKLLTEVISNESGEATRRYMTTFTIAIAITKLLLIALFCCYTIPVVYEIIIDFRNQILPVSKSLKDQGDPSG
jgi:hypothetical protein